MGLKKLLWNDNAREMFGTRAGHSDNAPRATVEPRGKDQARKLAKGSVAFTSALLFGTNESQGLLRTLAESAAVNSPTKGASHNDAPTEEIHFRYDRLDGPGYYTGNFKVFDQD
ncbi:hypothetical protein [Salinicola rhizosphaerae]|uniref:Uncharacterized protein n=1 Tax=Salinicola rhizosphaerae TaxID=1443141 RepID=A0ABQ3E8Z5_9GAMM|nr:hypothetical protein [Salinicola rhizosphaerae]GHB26510.1 hypothetical protein GCM10009038_26450 [Salinicola rhizosphaerae]